MSARVEVAKLARVLGEDPARLAYLTALDPADVRAVRDRATEVLFNDSRAAYLRIAAASRLVPNAITAAVAQRAFGPVMCARVASVLEADRALDLASRLPVAFLADVAAHLDPRRLGPILARLPLDRVVSVGHELVRRGDHLTMGLFVADVPDRTLRAVVEALPEEDLLRTALHSDSHDRLPALFAMIDDSRLPAFAHALTADPELTEDVVPLLTHLDAPGLARLAAVAEELSAVDRKKLRAAVAEAGVVVQLGPLADSLGVR
ncbi:hypothetical protein [Actinokineospora bangkokensis]|uniref:Magnesium transporter MgtE intracellular domain-containing protein n=1 Tax=Actinokineospora bangkokensis TaxID=1193682 RepID=A0A1Q9LRF8_9PSEU|nr:hypothetical protein [Actinokineospora bangkokensis]OLR94584.1 hypothetical protein BJP25_12670 [Actinokineospora bangkokensis]